MAPSGNHRQPLSDHSRAVTQHIKAIYEEGELEQNATCKSYLQVQQEGSRQVSRNRLHYSLPVILAVGYRVRSPRGTQFRQWATQTLQKYLIKGFVMDDERLKNPPVGSSAVPDYFDEMLERIRDIRASERQVYLRVRDLCVSRRLSTIAQRNHAIFQTIQNKLHLPVPDIPLLNSFISVLTPTSRIWG